MIKEMDNMASHYLVEDESWFLWNLQEKIRVWLQKKAIKPTTVKQKLTNRKTMVLIAFSSKPKRFSVSVLPHGQSVDATLILQMDNARPHTPAQTQQFLEGRGVHWSNSHPITQI